MGSLLVNGLDGNGVRICRECLPLSDRRTRTTGAQIPNSALAGKRTVVVFWSGARAPAGPPGLYEFFKKPPADTNWVYVSLGAWSPPARPVNGAKPAVKATAAPPGTWCVEPLGLRSPLVAQLKISSLPFACVLDERKNLNAFGRVDEIPAMLAGMNRLFEP